MWCGDADRRSVKIVKRFVSNDRDELSTPTAQARIFFNREDSMRAGDGAKNRLGVEWHQRAHVDYLTINAVFGLQPLRRFERPRHHERKCQNGCVLAGP